MIYTFNMLDLSAALGKDLGSDAVPQLGSQVHDRDLLLLGSRRRDGSDATLAVPCAVGNIPLGTHERESRLEKHRTLPTRAFQHELAISYFQELIFSMLPMFLIQVFNNSETETELTGIQSAALVIKVFSFLFIIVEIVVVVWEIFNINNLRELKLPSFERLTERERRREYSKTYFRVSVVGFLVFIAILIIGAISTDSRHCPDHQALINAVCVECYDENCQSCGASNNANICNECKEGFTLSPEGQCVDCDDQDHTVCKSCSIDQNRETRCNDCAEGYRLLDNGKCDRCQNTKNCATCNSDDVCSACEAGFTLNGIECNSCLSKMSHCTTCSSDTQCERCDYEVAEMDSNGQCTNCRVDRNWYKKNAADTKCTCDHFVNSKNGNKCEKCHDLIPGCDQCVYTNNPGTNLNVHVGYNKYISNSQDEYVMCSKCGASMFQKPDNGGCIACWELFTGCAQCNNDGSSCNICHGGYYKRASYANTQIQYDCRACSRWHFACNNCDANGCINCNDGFWTFGTGCMKAWW